MDAEKTGRKLSVPEVTPHTAKTNLIRGAVCELRYPTVLEPERNVAATLQKRAKSEYPLYEPNVIVRRTSVGIAGGPAQSTEETEKRHVFRSRDKRWNLSLGSSAISLETEHYSSFPDFSRRLQRAVELVGDLTESPFFTRVGLRYTNAIPAGLYGDHLSEWVNPSLCAPLSEGVYGTVVEFWQVIRGTSAVGKYSFRHGFPPNAEESYLIDIDSYHDADVTTVESVPDLVERLHDVAFALFSWSIGPRAREHMQLRPRHESAQ